MHFYPPRYWPSHVQIVADGLQMITRESQASCTRVALHTWMGESSKGFTLKMIDYPSPIITEKVEGCVVMGRQTESQYTHSENLSPGQRIFLPVSLGLQRKNLDCSSHPMSHHPDIHYHKRAPTRNPFSKNWRNRSQLSTSPG